MSVDRIRRSSLAAMLTFKCSDFDGCGAEIRVGRRLDKPIISIGPMKYCPYCGKSGMSSIDSDQNLWEALSDSWGIPEEAIILLYYAWPRHQYTKFRDFVDFVKKQALQGKRELEPVK